MITRTVVQYTKTQRWMGDGERQTLEHSCLTRSTIYDRVTDEHPHLQHTALHLQANRKKPRTGEENHLHTASIPLNKPTAQAREYFTIFGNSFLYGGRSTV